MSGICGVLARKGAPRLASDAEAMCRRLRVGEGRPEPGSIATLAAGPVLLGTSSFGRYVVDRAPTDREGRDVALALCGTLYDDDGGTATASGASPATILLERYLAEGISFVGKIAGDVSLAVWDGRTDSLYLATDRFRIHPLFYSDRPDQFVFASRIGALLASPIPFHTTIRPQAVADAVGTSIIPTPHTVFREVFKLPPGHVLHHRNGATSLTPYWQADFRHPRRGSEAAMARELRARFADSVARRLRVDGAPDRLGAFLSGGVDSSTVTGVLMQVAARRMKSFSIGFGEARYNEITYARIAARALGAEHFEYFVVPRDVSAVLPTLLASFDEPYGNASSVPTYFCARLAREHGVDVLYGGDGGDELFAGNERYATQRLFEYYTRVPRWLGRSIVEPTVAVLADRLGWGVAVKGKKYIRRALLPPAKRLTSYDFFQVIPPERFFTDDFLGEIGRDYNPSAALEALHDGAPADTELDRQLYLDLHLTIADNDLVKVTRMTEAAGVTVRFPFLDRSLAEFAMSVPANVKMRGRRLRSFFKDAYADMLPSEVRSKSKHGFGLPIAEWLRTDRDLADILDDAVLGSRALARGYFRREALEDLLARHRSDPTSFYGTTLWNLVILELWHRGLEDAGLRPETGSGGAA